MKLNPVQVSQKIDHLRSIHIDTERDRQLKEHLDHLLQVDAGGNQIAEPVRFTLKQETRGIALIEAAGGGKTTAIRHVLSKTACLAPTDGQPRYLEVQVPNPATLKSLGHAILARLGFTKLPPRVTAFELFQVIRIQLCKQGYTVLWIDEAQDLFLSRSTREIDDMLKMLKSMMLGEAGVIVILSGTGRLSQITSFDPQVNWRFSKIIPCDLSAGNARAINSLIGKYANEAGLESRVGDDLAARLIHGSRSRFGRAVETAINAIERALRDGADKLERDHFAEAWGMQEGCPWHDNVFVADSWSSIRLDGAADDFEAARTKRQNKQLERT
jgi:hypothetical protein